MGAALRQPEQLRRARRNALVLLLVVLAVYGGFIFMSVHRSLG